MDGNKEHMSTVSTGTTTFVASLLGHNNKEAPSFILKDRKPKNNTRWHIRCQYLRRETDAIKAGDGE
jgi:hypothetical protein